jgi:hypothetical protein
MQKMAMLVLLASAALTACGGGSDEDVSQVTELSSSTDGTGEASGTNSRETAQHHCGGISVGGGMALFPPNCRH